ncbi:MULTISPECIES: hypothetical protein [unclassified Haloferax]|jgi:hypothetical protein|uniref:hypothetical protein n=1 Tax=unclassified Haloferax TaxID=2625095 RepID=UPI002874C335|nr:MULTISPECIES: hypothetical protein [unclassified Haloferax]MDS0241374.1 hypothetical protein [Haloferax sp. S2CR25]MDS0444495.1 hypothetical protein [Haloferax sp. S2CR25-2]
MPQLNFTDVEISAILGVIVIAGFMAWYQLDLEGTSLIINVVLDALLAGLAITVGLLALKRLGWDPDPQNKSE